MTFVLFTFSPLNFIEILPCSVPYWESKLAGVKVDLNAYSSLLGSVVRLNFRQSINSINIILSSSLRISNVMMKVLADSHKIN